MNIKQRKIIQLLIERTGRRYSELFCHFEYEDKFPYHLKQLVNKNLIEKRDNRYYITREGIRSTTQFITRTLEEIELKVLRVLFVCNRENQYLLKPCFSSDPERDTYYILPGGSPIIGESLDECCQRLLQTKFNIEGKIEYRCTHHYRNYSTDGEIIFDNVCLVYDVAVEKFKGDESNWFTKRSISKLHKHPTVDKFILEDNREPFSESSFSYDYGFLPE